MTTIPYKFGYLLSAGDETPFEYPNIWAVEGTSGPKRLIIGPSSGHIRLIVELCQAMPEPFGALYVLLVPRSDKAPGRYQSPVPLSRSELAVFLSRFREYFECDGRHHLWIGAEDNSFLFVYDHHNVIYAYGPLEILIEQLRLRGFLEAREVRFPEPHAHHYNSEFDKDEAAVLDYLPWKVFPLQENDDL